MFLYLVAILIVLLANLGTKKNRKFWKIPFEVKFFILLYLDEEKINCNCQLLIFVNLDYAFQLHITVPNNNKTISTRLRIWFVNEMRIRHILLIEISIGERDQLSAWQKKRERATNAAKLHEDIKCESALKPFAEFVPYNFWIWLLPINWHSFFCPH